MDILDLRHEPSWAKWRKDLLRNDSPPFVGRLVLIKEAAEALNQPVGYVRARIEDGCLNNWKNPVCKRVWILKDDLDIVMGDIRAVKEKEEEEQESAEAAPDSVPSKRFGRRRVVPPRTAVNVAVRTAPRKSESKNTRRAPRVGPATKTKIAGPALLRVNHRHRAGGQAKPPQFKRIAGDGSRLTPHAFTLSLPPRAPR